MIIKLIYIGVIIIPFFIIPGMDSRVPKELLGFGLALAVCLFSLYSGKIKAFKNKWVLMFLGFMFVGIIFAPNFGQYLLAYVRPNKQIALLVNRDISDLWMYKAMFIIFIYTFMMICVASVDITKEQMRRIFYLMGLSGFLMSLYIFIQAAGLDQFFDMASPNKNLDVLHLDKPLIGGFMGQATVVAPFVAMIIPLALWMKKYLWALVMIVAVFLTVSKVAIVAMVIGLFCYFVISGRKYHKLIGMIILILVMASMFYYKTFFLDQNDLTVIETIKAKVLHETNGRIDVWKATWQDISTKFEGHSRFVTGFGPGSFLYSYSVRMNSRFWQLHCDPFELLYNFGIIGFTFFVMAIIDMIKSRTKIISELTLGLLMSLMIVGLCSFGTFSFQIAPIIFYTVIILGLLHNDLLEGYYVNS